MKQQNTILIIALILTSIACYYDKKYYRIHNDSNDLNHKVNVGNVIVFHICETNKGILSDFSDEIFEISETHKHKLYPKNHCGFFIEAKNEGYGAIDLKILGKDHRFYINVVGNDKIQGPALEEHLLDDTIEEAAFFDYGIDTVNKRTQNNSITNVEALVKVDEPSIITIRHFIYFGYGDDGVNSINKKETNVSLIAEVDADEYDYGQFILRDYFFYVKSPGKYQIVFNESEVFAIKVNVELALKEETK